MNFLTDIFCGITAAIHSQMDAGVKSAERYMKRLFVWFAMLSFCIGLLLVGLVFVLWGTYALLALAMGNSGLAALIVGVVVSLTAGILVMEIKNSVR